MLKAKALNRKEMYVGSIDEAVRLWERIRADRVVSEVGDGLILIDEASGQLVARVFYNSMVEWNWPEITMTDTFAPSKASGFLEVAQNHVDAQREMIALVDTEIMTRQCPHCGATMMLYCRCEGA